MQSTPDTPTLDDIRWTSAQVLRITLSQLRAWDAAEDAHHRVCLPQADEDAWEGTELDVRRTVL